MCPGGGTAPPPWRGDRPSLPWPSIATTPRPEPPRQSQRGPCAEALGAQLCLLRAQAAFPWVPTPCREWAPSASPPPALGHGGGVGRSLGLALPTLKAPGRARFAGEQAQPPRGPAACRPFGGCPGWCAARGSPAACSEQVVADCGGRVSLSVGCQILCNHICMYLLSDFHYNVKRLHEKCLFLADVKFAIRSLGFL